MSNWEKEEKFWERYAKTGMSTQMIDEKLEKLRQENRKIEIIETIGYVMSVIGLIFALVAMGMNLWVAIDQASRPGAPFPARWVLMAAAMGGLAYWNWRSLRKLRSEL